MQAVIFDIGNVLLKFEPHTFLRYLFGDAAPLELYHTATFGAPEWLDLDRGSLTQEEASDRLKSRYPNLRLQIDRVFDQWFTMLTPIQPSIDVLYNLHKSGYRVFALSNFHEAAFSYVEQRHAWFGLFHGVTISSRVGANKPEPAIYDALLSDHNLDPASVVFLDDSLANVQGAQQLGIRSIHFTNPEADLAALVELLDAPADILARWEGGGLG